MRGAEPALKTLTTNMERAFPVEQKNQTFITAPLARFLDQQQLAR